MESDQFPVKFDRGRTGREPENSRSTFLLASTDQPGNRNRHQTNSLIGALKYGGSNTLMLLGFGGSHGEKLSVSVVSCQCQEVVSVSCQLSVRFEFDSEFEARAFAKTKFVFLLAAGNRVLTTDSFF
jgi:hypothetical protein